MFDLGKNLYALGRRDHKFILQRKYGENTHMLVDETNRPASSLCLL
jgi:hypothetical protein